MKQGRASSSGMGSTKVNPTSRAVNPDAVADMGNMHGNHTEEGNYPFKTTPLYAGRGLEAPMVGTTIHHCGSQGKHK